MGSGPTVPEGTIPCPACSVRSRMAGDGVSCPVCDDTGEATDAAVRDYERAGGWFPRLPMSTGDKASPYMVVHGAGGAARPGFIETYLGRLPTLVMPPEAGTPVSVPGEPLPPFLMFDEATDFPDHFNATDWWEGRFSDVVEGVTAEKLAPVRGVRFPLVKP